MLFDVKAALFALEHPDVIDLSAVRAARVAKLGNNKNSREIEHLRSAGKLHCTKDGLLTVIEGGNDAA